jgi:hypothetical protein
MEPITVGARSKAWTAFTRSEAGIMGSNPTQVMDDCVRLICVYAGLCAGSGLPTGWSLTQRVLPSVKNDYETEYLDKCWRKWGDSVGSLVGLRRGMKVGAWEGRRKWTGHIKGREFLK